MSSFVRTILKSGIAVTVAVAISIGSACVFGQSYYDEDQYALPPPPIDAYSATVGKTSPAIAVPTNPSAPFGYNRNRMSPLGKRVPLPSVAPSVPALRPTTAESKPPATHRTFIQQISSQIPQPGWPSSTKAAGQTSPRNEVTHAAFEGAHDAAVDPSITTPAEPIGRAPLFSRSKQQNQMPSAAMTFPTERGAPPSIRGSHLGLQSGETAVERSLRLMTTVADLERQLEFANQQNAELSETIRHRDDQLLLAIREIKSTRRDVAVAKDELERLRNQVLTLQEKIQATERDNAALLESMARLLYPLLSTDAGPSTTPGE